MLYRKLYNIRNIYHTAILHRPPRNNILINFAFFKMAFIMREIIRIPIVSINTNKILILGKTDVNFINTVVFNMLDIM